MFTLANCLTLAVILVLLGIYGVLTRRSLIMILLSVEVLLNGVNITLISFNYFRWSGLEAAHYIYMLSIGVAAVEAAVGLAMIITFFRNYSDISRERISHLREAE